MLKRIILISLLCTAISQMWAEDIPIELDLSMSNQVKIKPLDQGGYRIETIGGDPYVMSKPLAGEYDPEQQYILSFKYFCTKGLAPIQLYYGSGISARQMAEGPPLLSSEGWTSYSMNIMTGQNPGSWRGGYKLFRHCHQRRLNSAIDGSFSSRLT